MSAMSDARLAEIEHTLTTEMMPHIRNALELLAEVKRLRAEPQAWHAGTLGYVVVREHGDHYDVVTYPYRSCSMAGTLFPTAQAAQAFSPDGHHVAPVFPMSAIGGADA